MGAMGVPKVMVGGPMGAVGVLWGTSVFPPTKVTLMTKHGERVPWVLLHPGVPWALWGAQGYWRGLRGCYGGPRGAGVSHGCWGGARGAEGHPLVPAKVTMITKHGDVQLSSLLHPGVPWVLGESRGCWGVSRDAEGSHGC